MVATWFLPNSLEDLLALALAGAVGYASILNLPLRRREAKDRLEAVSTKFTQVRTLSALQGSVHALSCWWHGRHEVLSTCHCMCLALLLDTSAQPAPDRNNMQHCLP